LDYASVVLQDLGQLSVAPFRTIDCLVSPCQRFIGLFIDLLGHGLVDFLGFLSFRAHGGFIP